MNRAISLFLCLVALFIYGCGSKSDQRPTVVNKKVNTVAKQEVPKKDVPKEEKVIIHQEKDLKLISPKNGDKISKRTCNITTSTPGYLDGTALRLYVQNSWNVIYGQRCHPEVKSERATGWAFLGDEYGNGIGEQFKIWLEDDSGKKSNVAIVTRTQ